MRPRERRAEFPWFRLRAAGNGRGLGGRCGVFLRHPVSVHREATPGLPWPGSPRGRTRRSPRPSWMTGRRSARNRSQPWPSRCSSSICEKWRSIANLAGTGRLERAGFRAHKFGQITALRSGNAGPERGEMALETLEKAPRAAIFRPFFDDFLRVFARPCESGARQVAGWSPEGRRLARLVSLQQRPITISLPVEGVPASLGPGLRTASGAKRRRGGTLPPRAVSSHVQRKTSGPENRAHFRHGGGQTRRRVGVRERRGRAHGTTLGRRA